MQMGMPREPRLIEPVHCPDVFAHGIGRIDQMGGDCVRLVFFVNDIDHTGRPARLVVAKLLRPISTILYTPALVALARGEVRQVALN